MPTDPAVARYRRIMRRHSRELADGKQPPQPLAPEGASVRTYGQDTILRLPPKEGEDDRAYLMKIGAAVMDMEFEYEDLGDAERDAAIIENLIELEVNVIA